MTKYSPSEGKHSDLIRLNNFNKFMMSDKGYTSPDGIMSFHLWEYSDDCYNVAINTYKRSFFRNKKTVTIIGDLYNYNNYSIIKLLSEYSDFEDKVIEVLTHIDNIPFKKSSLYTEVYGNKNIINQSNDNVKHIELL